MIYSMATIAVIIFTLAGITGAVMVGADALQDGGPPKALGVGILTATALLFLTVVVWLFQPGVML